MHKVLFFITGIGLGDSIREYSIIKELEKIKKVEIVIAGYGKSYEFFKDKYKTIKIKGFRVKGNDFIFRPDFVKSNINLLLSLNAQVDYLRKELKSFEPDLIVTDFEPLGIIFAKKNKKKFVEVFGVDPLKFKEFLRSRKKSIFSKMQIKYLNKMYSLGEEEGEAVIVTSLQNKTKEYSKFKFIDPVVREFNSKKVKEDKNRITVILGGSKFGTAFGEKLYKVLEKSNKKFWIIGAKKKNTKNCTYIPKTDKVLEYINKSSAVITLGGYSTISEAMVLKKPILSFPIPRHVEQEYNTWLLKNLKIANVIEMNRLNEKKIEQGVKEFIKDKEELKKNYSKLKIKSNGAKQAAKIISDIL